MTYQINTVITPKRNGQNYPLALPLSQNELDRALTDMGLVHGDPSEYTLNFIRQFDDELARIPQAEEKLQNIFQVNYIAQLMDSFDEVQHCAFGEVVQHIQHKITAERLLGIAMGIYNAEINTDITSFEDLGREYIKEYASNNSLIQQNINLKALGQDIVERDGGLLTDVGYIESFDDFHGWTFHRLPAINHDGSGIIELRISTVHVYTDDFESIFLPCERSVLDRALYRLQTSGEDYQILASNCDRYKSVCRMIAPRERFENVNRLATLLQKIPYELQNELNEKVTYMPDEADCHSLIDYVEKLFSYQTKNERKATQLMEQTVHGLTMTAVEIAPKLSGIGVTDTIQRYREMIEGLIDYWNLNELWLDQFDMEISDALLKQEQQAQIEDISF